MDAPQVPAARVERPALTGKRRIAARLLDTSALTGTALGVLLIAALLLRAGPWLANLPLHHDEALYGTWARSIADGSDPFLLVPWIDKPPLVLYLLGLSIRLFGASELALRVPGMIASVLTVWATFGLARATAPAGAAGVRAAWVAAGLMALSPFATLFAPTAFTDGWLTLFIVLAAWAALAKQPFWAGVLLGLACASKQQGVFGAPLVLALVALGHPGDRPDGSRRSVRSTLAAIGLATLGFAVVFGAVTYWDSLRWHNRPSYWDQSLRTYGGVVQAPLADWPQRALEWAKQAGYWFGVWPVTLTVLVLAAAVATVGRPRIRSRMDEWRARGHSINRGDVRGRHSTIHLLFGAYALGYLLVHIAFTFQPWDRYLLPILPLVCVLCASAFCQAYRQLPAVARVPVVAVLVLALLTGATLGVTASIPVGSDIGAYQGVAQAAQFLVGQPAGTTVYYDRIGWHLGYYLYDRPVTRSWYDSPQKLASEAARVAEANTDAPQWLALPAWEGAQLPALRQALAAFGLAAVPGYQVVGRTGGVDLTLYRLEPGSRDGEPAS